MRPEGLEPPTYCSEDSRSIHWAMGACLHYIITILVLTILFFNIHTWTKPRFLFYNKVTTVTIKKSRAVFFRLLQFNYLVGLLYAFLKFLTTSRADVLSRRLWAYECWVIISFYSIFYYLVFLEHEKKLSFLQRFRKIMEVNLLLLIFPWGLFLLLAPVQFLKHLGFGSIYWRILGFFSLLCW